MKPVARDGGGDVGREVRGRVGWCGAVDRIGWISLEGTRRSTRAAGPLAQRVTRETATRDDVLLPARAARAAKKREREKENALGFDRGADSRGWVWWWTDARGCGVSDRHDKTRASQTQHVRVLLLLLQRGCRPCW